MDAFHDFVHHCPKCNTIIGKSTPEDRPAEKRKGLKVVVGVIICSIVCYIIFALVYIMLMFGILASTQ